MNCTFEFSLFTGLPEEHPSHSRVNLQPNLLHLPRLSLPRNAATESVLRMSTTWACSMASATA